MMTWILGNLWSNRSFKLWRILYKERAYFGMKKKESGEQRESTDDLNLR